MKTVIESMERLFPWLKEAKKVEEDIATKLDKIAKEKWFEWPRVKEFIDWFANWFVNEKIKRG